MDGHFVPNVTIGPPVVASLRRHTPLFFDCHLMMTEPGRYLQDFADAGADGCTVHVEIGDTDELIAQMRRLGLRAGLALNPDTPFEAVQPYLGDVDLVLCMTVFPGFGGQSFMGEVMTKVERVPRRSTQTTLALDIEVDGGIDTATAPVAAAAGANVFVAGTAIFGHERPWEAADAVRESVRDAPGDPGAAVEDGRTVSGDARGPWWPVVASWAPGTRSSSSGRGSRWTTSRPMWLPGGRRCATSGWCG